MQNTEADNGVLAEEEVFQFSPSPQKMHSHYAKRRRVYESVEQGFSMWRDGSESGRKDNDIR